MAQPEKVIMPAGANNLLPDLVAFVLTLAVFSYLLGDNPAYRAAVHIFVGAAAGYAALIAFYNVIYPQMFAPLLSTVGLGPALPTSLLALFSPLVGLMLTVFLLLKLRPATNRLGSVATAFLIGVGSAVAIGGAVTGTLFPQTSATFLSLLPSVPGAGLNLEKSVEAIVIVGGTVATLGFFYYGARPQPGGAPQRSIWVKPLALVGQVFIGTAFGVMYAGALAASLAFFADRLSAMWTFVQSFGGGR